jgi:hypothetical protein
MTAHDTSGHVPSRPWAGIVDGATYKRLADAWRLGPGTDVRTRDVGPGGTDSQARLYVLAGVNWEVDNDSPIVYVSLLVSAPGGRESDVGESRLSHAA